MTADKKFDLGADVVQALKTIVDANAAVFEDAAETLPRSRAQRASADGPAANAPEEDRVFAWFEAPLYESLPVGRAVLVLDAAQRRYFGA